MENYVPPGCKSATRFSLPASRLPGIRSARTSRRNLGSQGIHFSQDSSGCPLKIIPIPEHNPILYQPSKSDRARLYPKAH